MEHHLSRSTTHNVSRCGKIEKNSNPKKREDRYLLLLMVGIHNLFLTLKIIEE